MINKTEKKTGWVKSTDVLAGLAFFLTSLFFFYDLLVGRYLLTERDLGSYFIPPRFFWVESIKHGEFPLWNPYQFSGHPFFANPQHAVLYPFNSLFFLLPFDLAFNAVILLHFFLGGLFTYFLLRDSRVSPTGSLLSGLIFMLSGYLLSVHSLLTILLSVIWTPLIMIFCRRAMVQPGLKNEIFTAIFITLSFLGGGIEIVYGNFFLLFFMMIFSFSPMGGHSGPSLQYTNEVGETLCGLPKWKVACSRCRSLFIVSVIFLFLSAVQLVPFLELFHHSIRGSGISYSEATIWSFAPKDALLFFLPDVYGYFLDMKKYWVNQCWFKTLYTGGLPFILSLIFFIFGRPTGEPDRGVPQEAATGNRHDRGSIFDGGRKFYAAIILFSLFLSLGQYNPLYPYVFKYFPFFNGIRYPVKFLYLFILFVSVTAGLGFQRLTEFSRERGHRGFKNILIFFSLLSGLFLLFSAIGHKEVEQFLQGRGIDFPDFNHLAVNLFHAKRFLFYLTIFFLFLRIGHEARWKGWARILLLFFLAGDLFGNMGFYGKEESSAYFKKTKIQETVSLDKGSFRVFATAKTISPDTPILIGEGSLLDFFREKHLPSLNMLHRLHDLWGIDVIRLKRVDVLYKLFTITPSISATNLIDLYGVKYVISAVPIEKEPCFELIYSRLEGLQGKKEDLLKENTIKLYKVRDHFPRAWLVTRFETLDENTILSKTLAKEFHPDQEALLEEEPKWKKEEGGHREPPLQNNIGVGDPFRGVPDRVEFILERNNRLHLRVKTKENAMLVLTDTYYPGWKAFVNGREEKIYRANYNFRAIPLSPGDHDVGFTYRPLSFKIGMWVSLLTLAAIVAYFIGQPRLPAGRQAYPREIDEGARR